MINSKMLNFALFIILFIHSNAQVKVGNNIFYAENIKIDTMNNVHSADFPNYDTLEYKFLSKLKEDFVVNRGCGTHGSDQWNVKAARDPYGNYMCSWMEERSGLKEINAQLFDSSDNYLGERIIVSSRYNEWNSRPDIIFNPYSDEYIIAWSESGFDIRLQRLTKNGAKIGKDFAVNQTFATNTNIPSLAISPSGNIFVTWSADKVNFGPSGIYSIMLDKDGKIISNQVEITASSNTSVSSFGWQRIAASDTLGNFIVTWSSYIGQSSKIHIQLVNSGGHPIGKSIIVSDSLDNSNHIFPTIASTNDGYYMMVWYSSNDVYARIFHVDSGFVTPQILLINSNYTYFQTTASSDRYSRFFITVSGGETAGFVYTKSGELININSSLVPDSTYYSFSNPTNTYAVNNSFYITYSEYDKNDQNVKALKFDLNFLPLSPVINIVNDSCASWQRKPEIKYNKDGIALICWQDRRYGTPFLYGQIFDNYGNPINGNFMINDSADVFWADPYKIASDENGNFYVFFEGGEYSSRKLLLQKVSSDGKKIGNNKLIANSYSYKNKIAIGINENDVILLGWYSLSNSYLLIQKLGVNMMPLNQPVNILNGYSESKKIQDISINKKLQVFCVWNDYHWQTYKSGNTLYGKVFNENGQSIVNTLIIDKVDSNRTFSQASCMSDTSLNLSCVYFDYYVNGYSYKINFWRNYRESNEILKYVIPLYSLESKLHTAKFINRKLFVSWNFGPFINSLFINDNDTTITALNLHEFNPFISGGFDPANDYSMDIYQNELFFAYESNKQPERGFDVYGNIQSLGKINFKPFVDWRKVPFEILSQPFPNPTNDLISFKYELLIPIFVEISLYDVLGQKINTLVKKDSEPGSYKVDYNIRELSSGVYFLHYKGIKSIVKKFVILR